MQRLLLQCALFSLRKGYMCQHRVAYTCRCYHSVLVARQYISNVFFEKAYCERQTDLHFFCLRQIVHKLSKDKTAEIPKQGIRRTPVRS